MMKRILFLSIFCFAAVAVFGDGLQADALYKELSRRQQLLSVSQDSLRSSLNEQRARFERATDGERDAISQIIVGLEGEIYDIRVQLGKLGGQIAAIEQQYAEKSLQVASSKAEFQSAALYENTFFKNNLSESQLNTLKSLTKLSDGVTTNSAAAIVELYGRLGELKTGYDNSLSQSQVDGLGRDAIDVLAQIRALDKSIGDGWKAAYEVALEQYLILLDKAGVQDRTLLEMLETEGRRVRRVESIAEQQSVAPNFTAFDAQRALVLTYEKALASTLSLSAAGNVLAGRKILPVSSTLPQLTFEPRVLTIYGQVSMGAVYDFDNVNDVPMTIIPSSGNYYSIQVALMNSKPKDLKMFKGAYPLQVHHSSDGKYRYMVGGFTTYAAALKGVGELVKGGFKYPQMVGWRDGKWATPSKIKGYDAASDTEQAGSFIIKISTKDGAIGEKLREVVDANSKGKSIARIASGDVLEFTVADFDSQSAAQALAQIIRLNVTPDVIVEELK